MKIDDLIKELQWRKERYGNREVMIYRKFFDVDELTTVEYMINLRCDELESENKDVVVLLP